ncbi:MAG: zf-HC2 domain-containing protein [Candidatus Solibacter usitatus]|nr:zf-HC2 domain-containing protein [Candidatus Solibacter usitatus]
MDCQNVKSMLSALQDRDMSGLVPESEQLPLRRHLAGCRDCSLHAGQLDLVRHALRARPVRPMPAHLAFSLRAMASREAARRRRYATFNAWLRHRLDHISLSINNLMRPIALPAAGGLASAVILFSMVMTNFQGIVRDHHNDVPLAIATNPSMKALLLDVSDAEIAVDVFVDENGRVIDYSFPEGFGTDNTSEMRRKLENSLLFTEFNPATTFGQPTSGWVRVKFKSRSQIDVKG